MSIKQEYAVKLELFEGPLDLLLYLVAKAEIDITEIQVSEITGQYLEYLNLMKDLNIDVAAEYLHMASTLVRLKSQELLPPSENPEQVTEEEGIYNKQQLIEKLLEYKKYKEVAGSLRSFESAQFGSYSRGRADQPEILVDSEEVMFGDIGIFDLMTALKRIIERAGTNEYQHVVKLDNIRVDDRIEHVLSMLPENGPIAFEKLFEDDMRRIVIVVTFMSLLELVKMQEIHFTQDAEFGTILVSKRHTKESVLLQRESYDEPEQTALPDESSAPQN